MIKGISFGTRELGFEFVVDEIAFVRMRNEHRLS
jgi:hypothetical protein